jgi:microcystin degradation protein MlrC
VIVGVLDGTAVSVTVACCVGVEFLVAVIVADTMDNPCSGAQDASNRLQNNISKMMRNGFVGCILN